jgi:hypothetical protein
LHRNKRPGRSDILPAVKHGIELVLARLDLGRRRHSVGLFSAAIVALLAAPLAIAAERIVRDADRTQAVTASRIIDRTLLCSTALRAGERQLDVKAYGASVSLFTPWSPDSVLAGMSTGSLEFNHKRCRPVNARVPLTARGMTGGPISRFGDEYDCTPPSRVYLRLRGAFRSRVAYRLTSWDDMVTFKVMRASGRVREGYLAVRTRAGEPILFVSVSDSGRGRVFTADSCIPS